MKTNYEGVLCQRLNLQLEEGIVLVEYGFEDFKNRSSIPRHRKINHHVLQFVVQGEGQYSLNDNLYHLSKYSLFYLPPNTPLKYQRDKNNPYKYFWISFLGKNVRRLLHDLDISLNEPVQQFDDTLLNLFSQFSSANLSVYTIKGICYSIFGYLQDRTKNGQEYVPSDKLMTLSDKLKEYVETNFNNPNLSLLDIQQALNLTETQLYRLSKSVFGCSTKKYLLQCRIKNAERLLKLGYTVTAASNFSGFSDVYYFSKVFKKKHGFSPNKFK